MLKRQQHGVTVEIFGKSLTFKNIENEALLERIAAQLEARMKEIYAQNPKSDTAKLAIHVALEASLKLAELTENAERVNATARSILSSLERVLPEPDPQQPADDEPFLLS